MMQHPYRNLFFWSIIAILWMGSALTCIQQRSAVQEGATGLVKKVKTRKVLLEGGSPAVLDNKDLQSRFFLVRHAEKEKGKDPGLLPSGQQRAKRLATIFASLPLRRIYATNYQRTQLTAAPLAEAMHLQITNYAPKGFAGVFDQLLQQTPQGNYLLVGHSNTIPMMLNHLSGKEVYPNIPESEYDNLYVVSVYQDQRVEILALKY